MAIHIDVARTGKDLEQILKLQLLNHSSSLTHEQIARDGFVTVQHSLDLLTKMNDAAPQVIAKDGDQVVAYALVMLKSFEALIPVLKPLFERLSTIVYEGKKIADFPFYVMGQICVDENYRGQSLVDALYGKHRELYGKQYRLCITSVSVRNGRSMRAHERVGFQVIQTFRDAIDEWNILVLDFGE